MCRAARSPESGCSTAAGAATMSAISSARRWNAFAGSLSRRKAWIPATAKPVAAYAASVMWMVWDRAAALPIAAIGSTLTARPFTSSNPAGAFIHAFAITTKMPDAAPLSATATPAQRCARDEIRSQPYR